MVSLKELCISCQYLKIGLGRLNKQNKGLSNRRHSISHFNRVYTCNFKRVNGKACLALFSRATCCNRGEKELRI